MTENNFFLIFLLTIIFVRVFIFFFPISSPTFGKFRIHHYMYGVLGIFFGLIFKSLVMYAIGLGLFIDELTYLVIGGKFHQDNYSKISFLGTILFIIIVFFLKSYLISFLSLY